MLRRADLGAAPMMQLGFCVLFVFCAHLMPHSLRIEFEDVSSLNISDVTDSTHSGAMSLDYWILIEGEGP
ncbi:MAG: hypothetical protein Alpg2KO_05580 [Alphaproteobacteria bacterium]